MNIKNSFSVEWECFEHILKGHTVIGLFPHLLCEIEMALRSLEVRIDGQSNRTIYNKRGRIKKGHQKLHCVTLIISHFLPILHVCLEGDFMREPGVAHCLIVEIIRPLVLDRMQTCIFRRSFSDKGHKNISVLLN